MTKDELEKYRQQLVKLGQDIKSSEAQLKDEALQRRRGLRNLSKVPVHLADLSSTTYEQEVSTQLLENERHLLIEIADALERIDQGKFGRCEDCQEAISWERLQAVPYARYCITCAQKESGQ